MKASKKLACALGALFVGSVYCNSFGALALSQSDGITPSIYQNGGGTGFGGILGGSNAKISMDTSGNTFTVGFVPGNSFTANVYVVVYMDTRSGGFTDATMATDSGSASRRAVSDLSSSGIDTFPSGMSGGAPDFAIAFSSAGSFLYELTSGGTNGLIQKATGTASSISFPMTDLSPVAPNYFDVNFFSAMIGITGSDFLSNESLPSSPSLAALPQNPGSLGIPGSYDNYNQFIAPEPVTLGFLGLGLTGLLRRRRK